MAHAKKRSMEVRLREYGRGLRSTADQMMALADVLDEANGGATPQTNNVRDGAGLMKVVSDDIAKILAGEELKGWVITGEVPL